MLRPTSARAYFVTLLVFAVGGLVIITCTSVRGARSCAQAADSLRSISETHERLEVSSTVAQRWAQMSRRSAYDPATGRSLMRDLIRYCSDAAQGLLAYSQTVSDGAALATGARQLVTIYRRSVDPLGSPAHKAAQFRTFVDALTHLKGVTGAHKQQAKNKLASIRLTSSWLVSGLAIAYLIALTILHRKTASVIIGPVKALTESAHRAMKEDQSLTLCPRGPKEIHALVAAVGSFATSLEAKVRDRAAALTFANTNLRVLNVMFKKEANLRRSIAQQLHHDANHDALTQLPNRHLLMNRMQHLVERSKRDSQFRFAVLFLDLDNFKTVNDSLGHRAGDVLLIEVARRLSATLRSLDTISLAAKTTAARFGGDEFVVLLEDIDTEQDAVMVAERIQNELSHPVYIEGQLINVSASVGIAVSDGCELDPVALLRGADIAMYRAKQENAVQHVVFDPGMHIAANLRLTQEGLLRRALEEQEFELFFQPIVSLDDGSLRGFESLLRWRHPEDGLVAPDNFIPLAEETGLIVPIGQWVLRQACHQLHNWHEQLPSNGLVAMSVNVSGRQLLFPDFIKELKNIIDESGVDPAYLNLEITESVAMEVSDRLPRVLEDLKALGIRLHMDDFGTGHSSLGCLDSFPFDVLKVDQSFVRRMDAGRTHAGIIRGILSMARSLDLPVVAEGIETQAQLASLLALDCDFGQGFFFSRPVDASSASELIVSGGNWCKNRQHAVTS